MLRGEIASELRDLREKCGKGEVDEESIVGLLGFERSGVTTECHSCTSQHLTPCMAQKIVRRDK